MDDHVVQTVSQSEESRPSMINKLAKHRCQLEYIYWI